MDDERSGADDGRPRGKVERVIRDHDLVGLGDELAERWQAEDERRASLRDLETAFNVRVLERRMEDAGLGPLDGEAANLYRLLTADDVSSGERTRAERQLEREGIDPEEVRADFVSHQSIHTYLTDHRGVTRDGSTDDSAERVSDRVRRLINRTRAVTRRSVVQLGNAGAVTVGEFDVTVDVRVYCRDCGQTYGVTGLVESGGCGCEPNETSSA
jgi:hypothetical protein